MINRREFWAFLSGMAAAYTLIGLFAGVSNVFLFGGLLLGFDVWQFINAEQKAEGK